MKSKKIIIFVVAIALLNVTALPVLAADPYGLETTAGQTELKNVPLPTIIGSIIGYVLSFIGILFLALLIYGGYTWMTSFGNTQKVEKARELIIDAIIGLIIIAAAYAITSFVINALVKSAGAA